MTTGLRTLLVPILLYALAAILYVIVALLSPGPGSADAAFYSSAASSIAHGHLDVNFLWSFNEVGAVIPANPTLPVPIGGHWLPGAAFVAAPFVAVLGAGWPVPALGPALVGALAAPVAWQLALDLGRDRRLAGFAGITVALGGALLPFLGQPDNHAISAGLGGLCLLLAGRAAMGSGRAFIGAAVAAAAMMLVRNDGVLYVVPILVGLWIGRREIGVRAVVVAVLAGLAVIGPWWIHQFATFGTLSPSAAGGRSLWIIDLNDFNRLGQLTPADLFANGLPALVVSRLSGLANAVLLHAVFFAVGGVLMPFALYAAVVLRGERVLKPTLAFAVAFFAAAVLIFAPHIANGMYLRSGASLIPATVVLGLCGLERVLARVVPAERRERAALGVFSLVVLIAAVLAISVGWQTISGWNARAEQWRWAADELHTLAAPDDRLLTYDAAGAYWYTGQPAVNTPNESADTLLEVAKAYDLRWLLVMRGQTIPTTEPLLESGSLPWLGPAAAQLTDSDGQTDVAIYPINLTQ